jgi:predicted nucleic acid-binding protein
VRACTPGVAYERLRTHPSLRVHTLDETYLSTAREIGVRLLLRGGDALYAAAAKLLDAPLISWDDELVLRAGAFTPDSWLAENP